MLAIEAWELRAVRAAKAETGIAQRTKFLRFIIELKFEADWIITLILSLYELHQNEGLYQVVISNNEIQGNCRWLPAALT
jgi:hypothetical protein